MLVTKEPYLRNFWYPLCFVEDLDQGPIARRLLDDDLVVWSSGDEVGVALDRCPHRSARLSGGWIDNGNLTCPYHGWQFGTHGRAVCIPQLDDGAPIPTGAKVQQYPAEVRYGVVWTALADPVRPIPMVVNHGRAGYRVIRQFDEVWNCAAPRLMDNSFDPAHIAFVHRGSFGNPASPKVDVPRVERTPYGMVVRNELVVENPAGQQRSSGTDTTHTTRRTVSEFWAPFTRVMNVTYPNGREHTIVTNAVPVDDSHLRLIQWCVRNDTEEDVPAIDVVAFDRQVTLEDKVVLEGTWPDFELGLKESMHIKVDRATIEMRRVLMEIVAGGWEASTMEA